MAAGFRCRRVATIGLDRIPLAAERLPKAASA